MFILHTVQNKKLYAVWDNNAIKQNTRKFMQLKLQIAKPFRITLKHTTNLKTVHLRSHSSWKYAWIKIACSAKILIILVLFLENSSFAFTWTRSYQVFGFWDISDHWKMITLFVRHSVKATILKSNIWNSCYNRDMVKKC